MSCTQVVSPAVKDDPPVRSTNSRHTSERSNVMRLPAPLTLEMIGTTTARAVVTGAITGRISATTVQRWGAPLDALVHGRSWILITAGWLVYSQRH